MPHSFEYDVFISYNSKNKDWVRDVLIRRIEQAGLKAFVDFRDVTPGAPSAQEKERSLFESRAVLLILSPDYVVGEWCEVEGVLARTQNPVIRDIRLIPVLKSKCQKPPHVAALTHIDFSEGVDLKLAWCQLLTALGRPPEPEQPKEPERNDWFLAHPYPMPPNFTGRLEERGMLTSWLYGDSAHPLLVLHAPGGFGKTALAWHWLTHDVKPTSLSRVVWWSFYECNASFDHFLTETLNYLLGEPINPEKVSAKAAVSILLQRFCDPGILLVLDGFERALRGFGGMDAAYQGDDPRPENNFEDCISPLAELFLQNLALQPNLRSKVLITTRLCPAVLKARGGGLLTACLEEKLQPMKPSHAVDFLYRQGIRGMPAEFERTCALYGFHPLSLRLLAGLIVADAELPGEITAAKRLEVNGDVKKWQLHVLEAAFESLLPQQKKLLSRISCFRSPSKYDALKTLAMENARMEKGEELDADLRELVARGLLHHDKKENRFDAHPIVRNYAYGRLSAPEREAAHMRLGDYFAAGPKPEKVKRLEDLASVIELYHHTCHAGQYDAALNLYKQRLGKTIYYQLGANQVIIDMLRMLVPEEEGQLPRLNDEDDQGWTLNAVANSYTLLGQPRYAVQLFERDIAICEKRGNTRNLAVDLGNLAYMAQIKIGSLRAAEANLRRSIMMCREIKDELRESIGHQELGKLLAYKGAFSESREELANSTQYWIKTKDIQGQCLDEVMRALRELLINRSTENSMQQDQNPALEFAQHALELADEFSRSSYIVERDYIQAHWLLGAAYRVTNQLEEAEGHLGVALGRCRKINCVEIEADILIELARLSANNGEHEEALRLAEEAAAITDRCGYVLQGADAHLEIARRRLVRGEKKLAMEYAQKAKDLANCDGPPDFTYKAAYDDACRMLKKLA
jgi:tetratricopeptide (TPR) repeat protein